MSDAVRPWKATRTNIDAAASRMMPLLNPRRSPILKKTRGAWLFRAMKKRTRGRSLNAVSAANTSSRAVAPWMNPYIAPRPKTAAASWDRRVWLLLGTRPSK
jgi:hypothetical protein